MNFAVVESERGQLEPVILTRLVGSHRLGGVHIAGQNVTFDLEKVVHVGITGEEDRRSSIVAQFCPRWLNARMAEAGYVRAARRIAANPGPGRYDGADYKSDDRILWTHEARTGWRKKEIEIYSAANRVGHGRWSALDELYDFGQFEVQDFLEKHRRELLPSTFLWCMIFAQLTADENTNAAEENIAGFQELLRRRIAEGRPIEPGVLTKEEFWATWNAGFREQKWKTFNALLSDYARAAEVAQRLVQAGTRDRDFRRSFGRQPGGFPPGLGVPKFSFGMELWGGDVACLDRWMFRALGAPSTRDGSYFCQAGKAVGPTKELDETNFKIKAHNRYYRRRGEANLTMPEVPSPPWLPFTEGSYVLAEYAGKRFSKRDAQGRVVPSMLSEYECYEDRLKKTDYYHYALREGVPNPIARAQWTMWEDILRRVPRNRIDKATHAPVFAGIYGKANVDIARTRAVARRWFKLLGGLEAEEPPRRLLENPGRLFHERRR